MRQNIMAAEAMMWRRRLFTTWWTGSREPARDWGPGKTLKDMSLVACFLQ
jgi:hypothetical protein